MSSAITDQQPKSNADDDQPGLTDARASKEITLHSLTDSSTAQASSPAHQNHLATGSQTVSALRTRPRASAALDLAPADSSGLADVVEAGKDTAATPTVSAASGMVNRETVGFVNLADVPSSGETHDADSEVAAGSVFGSGSGSGSGTAGDHETEWAVLGVTGGQEQSVIPPGLTSALARLAEAVDQIDAASCGLDSSTALVVAEQVIVLVRRISALHLRIVGHASEPGNWPTDAAYRSATSWLHHTHKVTGAAARGMQADNQWLGANPTFAELAEQGRISSQHVSVARRHATKRPWRQEAFLEFTDQFAEVATLVDPTKFGNILNTWGQHIDDLVMGDPDAQGDDRLALQQQARQATLHRVGDMWELNASLPDLDGALLAGVLNQIMETERRKTCTCQRAHCTCGSEGRTPKQHRADALIALAHHFASPRHLPKPHPGAQAEHQDASDPASLASPDLPMINTAGTDVACENGGLTADGRAGDSHSLGQSSARRGPDQRQQTTDTTKTGPPPSPPVTSNLWRAQVLLLVRLEDLQIATSADTRWDFTGLTPAQISARLRTATSQWQVMNGPGQGFLDRTTALTELCDAVVQRIITGPESQPLDIGRKTRIVPPAMRASLIARDRGCVFEGCDQPPGWCHAHHIQHWAQGGETSLQNLALVCDRHHTQIHIGQWRIHMTDAGHPSISPGS